MLSVGSSMASQETGLDSDADFYIPEFLWNFWLETWFVYQSSIPPYVGLHVYDTYKNELTTGLSDHPFSRGVFDQIRRHVPEVTEDPAWEEANSAFRALENDSETAIRSLLQQLNSKTRLSQMYGLSSAKKNDRSDKPKLSLGRHSVQALQKYLIFLRFRNRDTYEKLLKLANEGSLFLRNWGTHRSWKHPIWLGNDKRQPFSDWIELLKSFTCFFTGSDSKKCTVAFIFDCIHRRFKNIQDAEICIGISSEPDEYILSASCFGVVEEDGVGNLNDTFYYFFPISPHIAIYLLLDAPLSIPPEERISRPHFLHRDAHISSNIDHDVEASLDVYQRNALLLQTLPRYVIFVSSRSMIRTLTYYSERRWIPENLDYSKLLRGCREESVTHTLLVKASIEVIDLTDDVTMIGDYAISYGSFADVWKGVWVDRLDRGKKLVALKVLRANLVGYVHERLLKRLKKEVKAWYRLDHPHVAKLYGVVQLPNSLAMVSPWCENGTVVKYLKEINPDASRLQLLYEIASGVSYLHSCEPVVVHGDLKGCNILVNAAGRALITDFGLAKVKEEMSDVAELPTSFFAGSIRWMAPEIYKAQIEEEWRPLVSTYSDVYAFASVCLELLTGQLPYAHRRSDAVVTLDIMNGVKPSRGLQFVADPKTEVLWSLMNECWDELPRARPDMRKMCECLEHLVS
ncbi:kinase-like protein [Phellopilus nigrolimitatus]|nr:kinase-like protein [Phellopilus nigrolimitatus]